MYQIKLYSPIQIECEMPYEPPWMLGEDYRKLTNSEKVLCKDAVSEGMRKNKLSYRKNDDIQRKLLSLNPDVEVRNGRLMAVLTCSFAELLTAQERNSFVEWWKNECRNGYGKELRLTKIKTKKFGRIWVNLWNVSDWNIVSEETHFENHPERSVLEYHQSF